MSLSSAVRVAAAICTCLLATTTTIRADQLTRVTSSMPAAARPFSTEQEWIVSDVTSAVANMTLPPSAVRGHLRVQTVRAFGARSETTFDVAVPGRTVHRLMIVDHTWSPATYVAFATQLLASQSPVVPTTAEDLDARRALTNLRSSVLLDESARVSARLERSLRSPDAHESAALIVAALALREGNGLFADVRPALSRITAHLALARALRGSARPGRDGLIAEIVLTTLAGRQRDALQRLQELDAAAAGDADRAWARALRLRLTGDWRGARPSARDTLLEHLEYARAVRARLGLHAMLGYVEDVAIAGLPDWHRVAAGAYAEESADAFGPGTALLEIEEMTAVHTRIGPPAATPVTALAAPVTHGPVRDDGGGIRVAVLDWSHWAGFLQRHLCQTVMALHLAADTSDRSSSVMDEAFGDLPLYPIVTRSVAATPAAHDRAMTAIAALAGRRPELVPAPLWATLQQRPPGAPHAAILPDNGWFTPLVPTGTGFELGVRVLQPGAVQPAPAQMATWAQQMPYDPSVLWAHAWASAPVVAPPALSALQRTLGPLLEYDTTALDRMLAYAKAPPDTQVGYARTLCTIAPAHCHRLGEAYVALGRDSEASAAYDEWIERSPDRRGVASGVTWVVRYHHAHGRTERAETIALMAARQGVLPGLTILAELRERQGLMQEADVLFTAAAERFDEGDTARGAFLMRRWAASRDHASRAGAERLLRASFPRGLERMDAPFAATAPADGVALHTMGYRAAQAGLRQTDVIVAVDGWRVHGVAQYLDAIRFALDETVRFTVWRDGRYTQVEGRVPERWLGTHLEDYLVARVAGAEAPAYRRADVARAEAPAYWRADVARAEAPAHRHGK